MWIVKTIQSPFGEQPRKTEIHFMHESEAIDFLCDRALHAIRLNRGFVFLRDTKAEHRAIKYDDGVIVVIEKKPTQ